MRKQAIFLIISALGCVSASADQCYTYVDDEGEPLYGSCRRVSDNGRWACGADEFDEMGSFVINLTNPECYTFTPDGLLLDINDSGVAVGAWFERVGEYTKYRRAAVYQGGVWTTLPTPDNTLGQSMAVTLTTDASRVCGYVLCTNENPDEPGKQYPITWRLNTTTLAYEIEHVYNNLWLPGTYGFQVMDMSPDGRFVVGYQGLNVSDPIAVVLDLETGTLRQFHHLEVRDVTLVVPNPVTGEDVTFVTPELFVDGLQDGAGGNPEFSSFFASCNERYAFGSRNEVYDVDADGIGKIRSCPTVYDMIDDRFYDGPQGLGAYLCGTGPQLQFTTAGTYVFSGKTYNISEDFETGNIDVAGIYDLDGEGRTLVGSYIYTDPLGMVHECPVVLVLDEGLNSLAAPAATPGFDARVTVANGRIAVEGARSVAVYALSGAMLARSASGTLSTPAPAGTYIVVADGRAAKVTVK